MSIEFTDGTLRDIRDTSKLSPTTGDATPTNEDWSLSSDMVNQLLTNDFKRKVVTGIDVPEETSPNRTHFGAVVVFGNPARAAQIVREHNSHRKLVEALRQFVAIYPENARRHPDVAIAIQDARAALALAEVQPRFAQEVQRDA